MIPTYYFAYGSNIDDDQMMHRCQDSIKDTIGVLYDYQLFVSHHSKGWGGGVFSVRKQPGSKVYGVIYEISDNDLGYLDKCEGYPKVYDRKTLNVIKLDSHFNELNRVPCLVYISKKIQENVEVSPDYYYHCELAAKHENIELLLNE